MVRGATAEEEEDQRRRRSAGTRAPAPPRLQQTPPRLQQTPPPGSSGRGPAQRGGGGPSLARGGRSGGGGSAAAAAAGNAGSEPPRVEEEPAGRRVRGPAAAWMQVPGPKASARTPAQQRVAAPGSRGGSASAAAAAAVKAGGKEENAHLLSTLAQLRSEVQDLKEQIAQKEQKTAEFHRNMRSHFDEVRRNHSHLHAAVENLEGEQRQLQQIGEKHEEEEQQLQQRIAEAEEESQATEKRMQGRLMDRLVILLSTGADRPPSIAKEVAEEFEQNLGVVAEKIQRVKGDLDKARRENRNIAVNLSDEQSKTKRLHDLFCDLQGRLYSGIALSEGGRLDNDGGTARGVASALSSSALSRPQASQSSFADPLEDAFDAWATEGRSPPVPPREDIEEDEEDVEEELLEEDEEDYDEEGAPLLESTRHHGSSAASSAPAVRPRSPSPHRVASDSIVGTISSKEPPDGFGPAPSLPSRPPRYGSVAAGGAGGGGAAGRGGGSMAGEVNGYDNGSVDWEPSTSGSGAGGGAGGTSAGGGSGTSNASRERLRLMEEKMVQVLDAISFTNTVVRIRTGLYNFGPECAYLKLSADGGLYASHSESAPDASWVPMEEFVQGINAKSKGFESPPRLFEGPAAGDDAAGRAAIGFTSGPLKAAQASALPPRSASAPPKARSPSEAAGPSRVRMKVAAPADDAAGREVPAATRSGGAWAHEGPATMAPVGHGGDAAAGRQRGERRTPTSAAKAPAAVAGSMAAAQAAAMAAAAGLHSAGAAARKSPSLHRLDGSSTAGSTPAAGGGGSLHLSAAGSMGIFVTAGVAAEPGSSDPAGSRGTVVKMAGLLSSSPMPLAGSIGAPVATTASSQPPSPQLASRPVGGVGGSVSAALSPARLASPITPRPVATTGGGARSSGGISPMRTSSGVLSPQRPLSSGASLSATPATQAGPALPRAAPPAQTAAAAAAAAARASPRAASPRTNSPQPRCVAGAGGDRGPMVPAAASVQRVVVARCGGSFELPAGMGPVGPQATSTVSPRAFSTSPSPRTRSPAAPRFGTPGRMNAVRPFAAAWR